jgi:putative transposase
MNEIITLLSYLEASHSSKMIKHLSHIIWAMLCIPNRVTMLGLSRWTEKGGSYRTLQRFYQSQINWAQVHGLFINKWVANQEGIKLLIADEVVIEKVGGKTHGVGRFYSSKAQGMMPSVSFLAFSVLDVNSRTSYPMQIEQGMPVPSVKKTVADKVKRPPGRPKGSKNRAKSTPILSAHLQQLQDVVVSQKAKLDDLGIKYLVLDGKYGNYPAILAVRQTGLHLISKMRHDAALYLATRERLNLEQLPSEFLVQTCLEDNYQVDIYQFKASPKDCPLLLNVVVTVKTHLTTGKHTRLILFSTDLALSASQIVDYYSLRFQIEFNFRDAKQYWGLDEFMNVTPQAVTNAVNLAFLMVNLSQILLKPHRQHDPDFSILDLKALYRAHRYLSETIKLLPFLPEPNLMARIRQRLFRLGAIRTRYSDDLAA